MPYTYDTIKKTLHIAKIKANPANIFFQNHIADLTDLYSIKIQKNLRILSVNGL
jgi:hypothetical protein